MTNTTEKFDVFASGTFMGTFEAPDESSACQAAADEHGTVDVGQTRASTDGMVALEHRPDGMSDAEDYDAIFKDLNNHGEGYAPTHDDDADINELADALEAELVRRSPADNQVAVYHDVDRCRLILVGDAHGPWAVNYDYPVY